MACSAQAPVCDEGAPPDAHVSADAFGLRMANAGQITSVMRPLG
ncbi:MAG TPA: hypothetical protein VFU06_04770 [Longimicrobiales bacterium]|nr:hypothetical protein [Longimicrobiales bacterium]